VTALRVELNELETEVPQNNSAVVLVVLARMRIRISGKRLPKNSGRAEQLRIRAVDGCTQHPSRNGGVGQTRIRVPACHIGIGRKLPLGQAAFSVTSTLDVAALPKTARLRRGIGSPQ